MFKNKVEVDRHVDNSLKKIKSEAERNLRCCSFAKLYFNVGEYEQACRYISTYLSVKRKSPEGHQLLGKALEKLGKKEAALEAYRTSLQLNPKQNNLVIKVCELLASDNINLDNSGAKYFCELAQSFDPQNPAVFNLKERLIVTENDNPIDVTKLLLEELETRPKDINLRVKLLKHFLQHNLIKEAYKHASDIEDRNLTIFHKNLAWYEAFAEVLVRYQRDLSYSNQLTWEFWFLSVSVLDRLVTLSLDEHSDNIKNSTEYVSAVFNFDQTLTKAAPHINNCPDRQLVLHFTNHYNAQLNFHLATLIYKQAKKDLLNFKEASNISLPVVLAAYHSQPPDLQSVWLQNASESHKRTVQRWAKEASFRCSQTGHILQSAAKDRKNIIIEKATQYSTGMWREQLFKKLFVKRDQQLKVDTSYFVTSTAQLEPIIKLPDERELLKYDETAQLVYPDSLHHYIWVARGLGSNLPKLNLPAFAGLQYTIKNLSNCSAESLNLLDVHAFIYCATLCAQSKLDDNKHLIYYNQDKPSVLPSAITEDLATLNQSKFMIAAYKMYKNDYDANLGELRLLLIKGIEVIRCVGQHGLNVRLLVQLANIFAERSKNLTQQSEIEANDARAELYWKTALPLLEKLKNNQVITTANARLFEYKAKEMSLSEVTMHIEKGKLFTAIQLMKKKEHEKALAVFELLRDPYASFYQSQIYKQMADQKTNQNKENVTSEMRSQNIILLSRARDCLYLTLDRLREPAVDRLHPLNAQLGSEIEKIERLLSRIDPDCTNRNECDGMSDENVSSDSAGDHYLSTYNTTHFNQTSFHNTISTPKHEVQHSTPYRYDVTRREARPSPERLDAQIRQLTASKDAALNNILEQNKLMVDSNRCLLEELRTFKDAVNHLTATVEDLKTIKSGFAELKEIKQSVDQLKSSVDDLQNIVDVVHEMKKEISELKKDASKNNQLSEEDLYVLDPDYADYNINSNMAAYNPYNYQNRLPPNPNLGYGPNSLYPGLYPPAMAAYAYGGLGLPQAGALPFVDQQMPPMSLSQQAATYNQAAAALAQPLNIPSANLGIGMLTGQNLSQALGQVNLPKATLSTLTSTTQSVFSTMNSSVGANNAQHTMTSRAAPVNVVITASDPLPTNTTPVSQPILSVTIPPQHLKGNQKPHNYQIALPATGVSGLGVTPSVLSKPPPAISTQSILSNVAPPIFSAVGKASPSRNVTLGQQIEKTLDHTFNGSANKAGLNLSNISNASVEEYDPCPDFKPIIPLPDEVPANTGEECETVLFCERAKLFRHVTVKGTNEWKERGVGNLKILLNSATGKVRILMRRDQIFKICANHYLTPDMVLSPMQKNDRAYIWAANDFADETVVLEKFCVRFKTGDEAKKFYDAFESAKKKLSSSAKPAVTQKSIPPTKFEVVTPPVITIPVPKSKPISTTSATTTSMGGFVFTTTPNFKPKEIAPTAQVEIIEVPTSVVSPFSSFTFGTAKAASLLPGSIFQTSTKPAEPTTFSPLVITSKTEAEKPNEEGGEDFVPTAEFKPVVSLPDLVEVKTGEENAEVLFEARAKLLRLDTGGSVTEWKERGVGTIKVLKEEDIYRLVMRREQVHKVCCNHQIIKELVFKQNDKTPKAVFWHAKDFSEGVLKPETFTVLFKTPDLAKEFLEVIKSTQNAAGTNKHHKPEAAPKQTGFGDKFKANKGSWECKVCYIVNENKQNYCVACETPKVGTAVKKPDVSGPGFSFGVATSTTTTTASSWGNAFKPAEGTWECTTCYIRNNSDKTVCVSCDTPKAGTIAPPKPVASVNLETPGLSFSFGVPKTTQAPTTTAAAGFGEAFKPKLGSWECKVCYIRNEGDALHCASCESPKDDTVSKKEPEIKGVNLETPGLQFSFGLPAATSATEAPVTTKKTFAFGDSTSINSTQFSFGSKITIETAAKPASTAAFSFATTTTSASKADNDDKFVFGSPQKHDFEFTPRSPRRISSGHGEDAESDGSYVEEEVDNIYFKPVIPLPDKIDVKTGEEDEEILYCHRAKLFRFVASEWKERGTGDVKILRKRDTGKLRVLMRREQVLKICLNHILNTDVNYISKDEKSWLFHAGDYSEGELVNEKFCLRFKNAEIAQEFKNAVSDAVNSASTSTDAGNKAESAASEEEDDADAVVFLEETTVSEEDEKEAIRLGLPPKYLSYKQLPDCNCEQCKKDDQYLNNWPKQTNKSILATEKFEEKPTVSPIKSPIFGTPVSSTPSTPFSFTPTSTPSSTSLKELLTKPAAKPNLFSTPTNIFSTPSTLFGQTPPSDASSTKSSFTFASNDKSNVAPKSTSTSTFSSSGSFFGGGTASPTVASVNSSIFDIKPINFGSNASGSSIFGGSSQGTFFSGASTPTTTPSIFNTATATSGVFGSANTSSIFGAAAAKPIFGSPATPTSSTTSLFATTTTSFFGSPATSITTSGSGIFSSAALPATTQSSSIFGRAAPTTTSNLFGSAAGTNSASIFGAALFGTQKPTLFGTPPVTTTNLKEDDAVVLDCNTDISFAALAATTGTKEPSFTASADAGTTPFAFLGAGAPVFGGKAKKEANASKNKTESDDEAGANDQGDEYDPHYEPIVPLPDAIVVSTGEENETPVFNERAKLYRFDATTGEWKERGVGQMKILHHSENRTYRFLLRREQVHKIVLNQLITSELSLKPMSTSDTAWIWAGYNYTDEEAALEKLAIRFKNVDLAKRFYEVVQSVVCKVIEIQNSRLSLPETVQNFNTETVQYEVEEEDEHQDEGDHEHDVDQDDDDDEYEDDDKTVMFMKTCNLSELLPNGTWAPIVENGDLQIYYDPEIYASRISVNDEAGEILSNTLIGMNTLMDIQGNDCIWKAVEWVGDNFRWRSLKASFNTVDDAAAMHTSFLEGLNLAEEVQVVDDIPSNA